MKCVGVIGVFFFLLLLLLCFIACCGGGRVGRDGMGDVSDESNRFSVIVFVRGKISVCFFWFCFFLLQLSGKVDVFLCVCACGFSLRDACLLCE